MKNRSDSTKDPIDVFLYSVVGALIGGSVSFGARLLVHVANNAQESGLDGGLLSAVFMAGGAIMGFVLGLLRYRERRTFGGDKASTVVVEKVWKTKLDSNAKDCGVIVHDILPPSQREI